MARFDVYANPDPAERKSTPNLLDVQNNYIDALSTRVVLPLRREAAFGPAARHLNPVVIVGGEAVVLDTAAIGAVPAAELKKWVASLKADRNTIQDALDTLLGGF
jgi:toxin CcdB